MDRQWSRIGARVASVVLLVAGAAGGLYLGEGRPARPSGPVDLSFQVQTDEMQLLKARQNEHVAARAWQREAESEAAEKASAEATNVAGKAHDLAQAAKAKKAADKAKASGGTVPYNGPIPTSCKEFGGNRATGCALMLAAGYGIDQFPCLNNMWNKESGWNHKAENPNGAYGIPQAFPGNKMASVGSDWRTNPATQIKWGLGYIRGKYQTPCGAWTHWEANHSY
ncbi:transglycosylase SLT domain-containing protein [Actinoplanes subtropicus]|uniref:aggregation-promoting factor C-terminal-like domain-containing protein n=1 Tax=Actinoplanes subtropicus TaxID=543632 RepID=UPI0004C38492|nr:transglycosylase SLT domain-containing protein [Actinoplanes subtropicus]